MKKNEIIRLTITNYSNDGSGVGRYEGMAVFVPFTAIGDEIDARIVKVQKTYAYGIIDSILTASPARIDVDCPHYGRCGGCNFRHISYEEELKAKEQFVTDALKRIGNIETVIEPIIGAPHTDYYRNKVQFPISSSEDRLFPAFYQPRSHRAIDISDYCKLQPEVMNQIAVDACDVLSELGETAYNEVSREGNIRHLLIRKSSIDGSVLLCVICRLGFLCDENRFIKKMCDLHPEISTIVTNKNETEGNEILSETHRVIYGSGYIEDVIADVPVNITYDSFYQINQESTENLYRCIKDFASVKENDVVVDLYCGAGTIGLSCSGNDCVLIGVDVVGRSIESARNAASQLGRKNAEFVIGDSSYLQTIIENGIRPSLIITDPPRKGCSSSVIQSIISSKTEKIVMVSCNPSTLARDLKLLMDGGYNVDKIQPVDMFPRTKHIETVCLLTHKD